MAHRAGWPIGREVTLPEREAYPTSRWKWLHRSWHLQHLPRKRLYAPKIHYHLIITSWNSIYIFKMASKCLAKQFPSLQKYLLHPVHPKNTWRNLFLTTFISIDWSTLWVLLFLQLIQYPLFKSFLKLCCAFGVMFTAFFICILFLKSILLTGFSNLSVICFKNHLWFFFFFFFECVRSQSTQQLVTVVVKSHLKSDFQCL